MSTCSSALDSKRRAAYEQQARAEIGKQLAVVRSFSADAASVIQKIGVTPATATSQETTPADIAPADGSTEAGQTTPEDATPEAKDVPEGEKPLTAPEAFEQVAQLWGCLLYTSPSPRDQRGSRMPSSA